MSLIGRDHLQDIFDIAHDSWDSTGVTLRQHIHSLIRYHVVKTSQQYSILGPECSNYDLMLCPRPILFVGEWPYFIAHCIAVSCHFGISSAPWKSLAWIASVRSTCGVLLSENALPNSNLGWLECLGSINTETGILLRCGETIAPSQSHTRPVLFAAREWKSEFDRLPPEIRIIRLLSSNPYGIPALNDWDTIKYLRILVLSAIKSYVLP